MRFKCFIVSLLVSVALHSSEICFFTPPAGWEIANPELLAPRVRVAFLGKGSNGFSPSVNLAVEEVNISLEKYIQEVRKIHSADPNSIWRDLGKFSTPLGEGRLTQLESPTNQGMARLMQLIVIKEQTAYILTTAALKEEFPKYYQAFRMVLNSLQLSSDLIESYPTMPERLLLKQLVQNLEKDFTSSLKQELVAEETIASENFQTFFWKPFEQQTINAIKERTAYILTTATLKEALSKNYQPVVLNPFQPPYNLIESYSAKAQRLLLDQLMQNLEKKRMTPPNHEIEPEESFASENFQTLFWKPFEQKIINDFTKMGPYWQIMLLQQIQAKLLTPRL